MPWLVVGAWGRRSIPDAGIARRRAVSRKLAWTVALALGLSATKSYAEERAWQPEVEAAVAPAHAEAKTGANQAAVASVENAESYDEESGSPVLDGRPPRTDTQPPLAAGEERPRPAYAATESPAPGLWPLRIALFPLYATSEYLVRRPIRAAVKLSEEHYVPEHLIDWFTFGPERQAGIVPMGYADLGFRPRIGVLFFWNRALVPNHSLTLRAETAPFDTWRVTLDNVVRLDGRETLRTQVGVERRLDRRFWGLGPSSEKGGYVFGADVQWARVSYGERWWRRSRWNVGLSATRYRFDPVPGPSRSTSVGEALEVGELDALPPGLEGGYAALVPAFGVSVDTRPYFRLPQHVADVESPPGSGVRLALDAQLGSDLEGRAEDTTPFWLVYGVQLATVIDLNGRQRLLSLSGHLQEAVPLDDSGEVPFLELPSLGGNGPMPGFRSRRLMGQSSIAARLEYSWPIWVYLDGAVGAALGNVFGQHLEGFDFSALRASMDVSVRTIFEAGVPDVGVLIGSGTRPLGDGGRFEELRFVVLTSGAL